VACKGRFASTCGTPPLRDAVGEALIGVVSVTKCQTVTCGGLYMARSASVAGEQRRREAERGMCGETWRADA
jgi:hypothetical protein